MFRFASKHPSISPRSRPLYLVLFAEGFNLPKPMSQLAKESSGKSRAPKRPVLKADVLKAGVPEPPIYMGDLSAVDKSKAVADDDIPLASRLPKFQVRQAVFKSGAGKKSKVSPHFSFRVGLWLIEEQPCRMQECVHASGMVMG